MSSDGNKGPYYGPKGGKYQDANLTIPWKENAKTKRLRVAYEKALATMQSKWGKDFRQLERKDFLKQDHYDRFSKEERDFAMKQADYKNHVAEQSIDEHDRNKETEKSMTNAIDELEEFSKGGPYIGPRGGKYADPKHTTPWTGQLGVPGTGKNIVSDEKWAQLKEEQHKEANPEVHGGDLKEWSKQAGKLKSKMLELEDSAKKAPRGSKERSAFVAAKKEYESHQDKRPGNTKKSMEATMNEIDELEEFAKGAMPSGAPSMGSGPEQGGNLAGVGKTSGSGDSSPGEAINAPKVKDEKLSEDDEKDEKQLKPGKKPIETAKSVSPMGQRETVAHESAALASKLRKGQEDVDLPVGVAPPPEPEPEQMSKGEEWNQGDDAMVHYSNRSDMEASELLKSDSFYANCSPSVGRNPLLGQTIKCQLCSATMSKSLSACPTCGAGTVRHRIAPSVHVGNAEMTKSSKQPPLRPRVEQDVKLSDDTE